LSFSKKIIAAWASYDFSTAGFSGIMVTFVFPIFYRSTIVTHGNADVYWGRTLSASMLLVALVTPLLGAMADVLHNKKLYLGIFTVVTIGCTLSLYWIQPGMILVASLLFVLANVGYEGGTVFYDAFLPEITTPQSFGRVSGLGFACSYFGSLLVLGLIYPFIDNSPKTTFLISAGFFALFASPLFFVVPEERRPVSMPLGTLVRQGFAQLGRTACNIRNYKDITRFLIAFFLYNDAILTVVLFGGPFAHTTLGFTMTDLALWFGLIQIVAVTGSLLFGKFADRFGPKRAIVITLFIWIGVVTAAFFTTTKFEFYIVGAVAGLAMGSSQSCSRSLMALLTPPEHTAEFFGFYDGFCGKASAIIGPLIFGELSGIFGSQRPAIWALAVFFIIGLLLLRRVDEKRAEQGEGKLSEL
jgi:MFS transporter, UMF1 family